MKTLSTSILSYFTLIPDPRVTGRTSHKLEDIFFITLCAAICGADDWVAVAAFSRAKKAFFDEVLGVKERMPCHDTFGRIFAVIDTEKFSECFILWVNSLVERSDGEIIALDGKCLRRSMDKASNLSALYMVSAWAVNNQLVLGQEKVDLKSNEITAIPKLLERLDIKGSVVTMDAMGCQTKITEQIIDNAADYMINLKGNQGNLHKDVKDFFESKDTSPPVSHETFDAGHGRFETRTIRATSDIGWLQSKHPKWAKLTSIVAVTSKRELDKKTTEDTRYFISSLDATDPEKLGYVARAHWGIENKLHWVLDYAFDEDSQRTRAGNSAANMAIIRHLALNMLKSEKTAKVGMKTKRLKAGWDDDYMLKLLTKSACVQRVIL